MDKDMLGLDEIKFSFKIKSFLKPNENPNMEIANSPVVHDEEEKK